MQVAFLWIFLLALALSVPVVFGLIGATGLVMVLDLGGDFDARTGNKLPTVPTGKRAVGVEARNRKKDVTLGQISMA